MIWDGWNALKVATAELVDSVPQALVNEDPSDEAQAVSKALYGRFPEAEKIMLRETGRFFRVEVVGVVPPPGLTRESLNLSMPDGWRVDSIAFRP